MIVIRLSANVVASMSCSYPMRHLEPCCRLTEAAAYDRLAVNFPSIGRLMVFSPWLLVIALCRSVCKRMRSIWERVYDLGTRRAVAVGMTPSH